MLYKAQVLSFIECRTAAIYHACQHALDRLQHVQEKLLEAAGLNSIEALNVCRLAPLSAWRDMALLGLIHRSVLGRGPTHFGTFFKPNLQARQRRDRHSLQLVEYRDAHVSDFLYPGSRPAAYIAHSVLGLISVYNRLPASIVERCACVSSFQRSLQDLLATRANAGAADWTKTFCPRVSLRVHP